MRSHALRNPIAPAQGYICFSCRLQVVRRLHPASRRYQHSDGSPQEEQEDPASKPSFADRMRAFLSSEVPKKSVKAASHQAQYSRDSGYLEEEGVRLAYDKILLGFFLSSDRANVFV